MLLEMLDTFPGNLPGNFSGIFPGILPQSLPDAWLLPEPPSDLLLLLSAVLLLPDVLLLSALASLVDFFVLKSVSYQPEPLRRKLLAETSFFRVDLPQAGQSVKGASLNFWIFSSVCPHDSHRYS